MALTVTFSSATTQNDQQATDLGGATGKTSDVNEDVQITLNEGTGAAEANITLQDTITLNAGNSYEVALDIFAGALVDEFGVTFNIKELKGIFIEVTTATALANAEVFADQSTPADEFKGPLNDVAGDGLTIETGQSSAFTNSGAGGWTVDATHKFLVFRNNNTTDTTINILIAGVLV
jgi:hypothetical protein